MYLVTGIVHSGTAPQTSQGATVMTSEALKIFEDAPDIVYSKYTSLYPQGWGRSAFQNAKHLFGRLQMGEDYLVLTTTMIAVMRMMYAWMYVLLLLSL